MRDYVLCFLPNPCGLLFWEQAVWKASEQAWEEGIDDQYPRGPLVN